MERTWIVMLCIIASPVFADPIVDSLLTVADAPVDEGAREDVLRRASKIDKTGRAAHALGRFYMESGGMHRVYSAERWLKRAMDQDRDNGEYLASLAEFYWRIGRRTTAIEYARRGVDRDPNAVGPLYWAARFEMWQMTRYLDGEVVDYNYDSFGYVTQTTFSQERWGIEARDRAVGYLTRAIQLDPDHWPSYHLLGLVYYEGRMPRELIGLFEDYTERHPENANAHFFLGLGHQATDDLQRAYRAYTRGLAQMSKADQQFMMSVFLVADPDSTAPDHVAIRRFWTGRDPLFLTEYNERLLEHCRRVAYADLRFGDPLKNRPGWQTDKGQAYIRYGHPISLVARPAAFETGVDLPGYMQDYLAWQARTSMMSHNYSHRREIWHYDGFTLVFENPDMRDYWTFRIGWLDGAFNPLGFKNFLEVKPEHFRDPYWQLRYEAPHQVAQFRGEDDQTRVEVYYALDAELVETKDFRPGLKDVNVKQGLFLFDAAWDTLRRDIVRVPKMPHVNYDAIRAGYLLSGHRLNLAEGQYYLAAEVEDQTKGSVGTFRDTLSVRSFMGNDLQVSDLLMARRVVERESRPFGRDRFLVLSNPLRQYPREGQAVVYFEVYNLVRDDFGGTHYRLTFQVRSLAEEGDLGDAEWATAISYEQRGNRDWEPLHLALDLDKTMPGPKALRVVVTDLETESEAMATTEFRVMW